MLVELWFLFSYGILIRKFIRFNFAKVLIACRATTFGKVSIARRATTFGKVCDVKVIACAART